jgi:hypothetical protein
MSGKKTYTYTVPVNIKIETINKDKIKEIEETLSLCIDRKLEKLNILLKNVDIYLINNNLIVNDRYNANLNFKEVVNEFGIDIKEEAIEGLKGKTYILGDLLTKLLATLDKQYDFSKILNIKDLKQEVIINPNILFDYKNLEEIYDKELISFLKEIRKSGSVNVKGIETITDGISMGVVSDQNRVVEKLKNYLNNIEKQVHKNNEYLQKGTTELIYNRARQMGYSVKKEINNKQVQLVLVRTE